MGKNHDHEDACGLKLEPDELLDDDELPEAAGGVEEVVEPVRMMAADLDKVDACDADFTEDPTDDDELPVAVGGVE